MSSDLEPYRPPDAPAVVHTAADFVVSDATRQLIADGVAANTTLAYVKQWDRFAAWCATTGRVDLPATEATLTEYVQHLAATGRSPATIAQVISAVRAVHRAGGHRDQPLLDGPNAALKGHRKNWADRGGRVKKSPPVLVDALRAMVATCDTTTLVGVRDRAVLVLGWAMMARRSEVAALMADDVREVRDGLSVYVARSKTDQLARGAAVAIAAGTDTDTDPVRVVRAWRDALATHGVAGGRLFRSIDRHGNIGETLGDAAVNRIVKAAVRAAGIPHPDTYSSHGSRAGGATAAYLNAAPMTAITEHGRWSPNSSVVMGYIRAADQWRNNPMSGIGL